MALRFSKTLLGTGTGLALALAASAASAPVSGQSDNYNGVTEVSLEGFVGRVIVETGESQTSFELTGAKEGGPLKVDRQGNRLVIEGNRRDVEDLYRRGSPAHKGKWGWRSDEDAQANFEKFLEDYPTVTVRMPAGSSLSVDHAAIVIDATGRYDTIEMSGLYEVYGSLGKSENAMIGISGMGFLHADDVTEQLEVGISGSGSFVGHNAGRSDVRISGSGDVELNEISGALTVRISGSGDVDASDIAAATEISISGSGDVVLGHVGGGLDANINGSGDIEVESINGPTEVGISGSGDVSLGNGRADSLSIRINGGGDVDFDGVAVNPKVRVSGSGDVRIKDYEGNVNVSGDGDVRIGNLTFDD